MSTLTAAHPAGKKRRVCNVVLLNGEEYFVYIDVKSKFQDVFNQVATYLTLRETEYFGLSFQKEGEYQFVSNEEKIHKHAPKGWKNGTCEGFDVHGQPLLTVHFRVQFYVDQVVLLREKVTRHLYYLQLKQNVLHYQHAPLEEKWFLVAAYALQADFGNYSSVQVDDEDYFDPREYFPAWMVETLGVEYLVENTPLVHRDLQKLPRSEAEWRFIKETSLTPAAHNLHFYRLKKRKTDKVWNAWLGICAKGIEIYEDLEDGFKDLISTFLWPDIGKLTFDKKKFEIRSVGSCAGRKFTYYTDSDVKSKFLLTLSRNTHMFQLAIQPKLMEIRHLDAEDKRRYRESYIYSDPRDLVTNGGSYGAKLSPCSISTVNRFSVVSNTSSNTTSGIASDKMTVSFEENDVSECSREVMIDCPPLSDMLLHTPSPPRSKVISTLHTPSPPRSKVISTLHTPSPPRSKVISTLPGYKPSPLPGANRSPVLENRDQFSAYTLPSNKTAATHSLFTSRSSGKQTSGSRNYSQSDSLFNGSDSYNKACLPKQSSGTMCSPVLLAPKSTSQKEVLCGNMSRPASCSVSRKDSIKETLAQLQLHCAELKASQAVPQPLCVETTQLKHVPSFHMEDLVNHPVSCSGSSDNQTHHSYTSDASNQSSLVTASCSTVTSLGSPQQHHTHPMVQTCTDSCSSSEIHLQEPEEYMMPPPPSQFADTECPTDFPVESIYLQSLTATEQDPADLQTVLLTGEAEGQVTGSLENVSEGEGSLQKSSTKSKPTHITVQHQKEVLHPEIEEIRWQPHNLSLPFITALCNDKSLLPNHSSRPASVASTGDLSVLDSRRLSVNFPSGTSATMVTMSNNRPFSWHSESFDLDAQLFIREKKSPTFLDNHHSVPQSLSDFTTSSTSSWTQAISYSIPSHQTREPYSPELIASQLIISPNISSGSFSKVEGAGLQHKALMKENFGIA